MTLVPSVTCQPDQRRNSSSFPVIPEGGDHRHSVVLYGRGTAPRSDGSRDADECAADGSGATPGGRLARRDGGVESRGERARDQSEASSCSRGPGRWSLARALGRCRGYRSALSAGSFCSWELSSWWVSSSRLSRDQKSRREWPC